MIPIFYRPLCSFTLIFLALIVARPVHAETLECSQVLSFGTFVSCGSSQSATLTPLGAISGTGCLTPMGGHTPGRCRLRNITDTSVIMIEGDGVLDGDKGSSMNIDQFMLRPLNGGTTASTIDVTSDMIGTDLDFAVGATLHIDGTQKGGTYNGTYTLTINLP